MKRLAGQTGTIIDQSPHENDNEDRLTRRAILFHEGTFDSQDGEISFDAERIQTVVDNHNQRITELADQYGGIDKMPIGAYPPILDQHDDNSTDKIRGRLASLLKYEVRNIPGVGVDKACATADIVFLGRDTVEKVKDGRIYHLSIGIDEATNTLGETSTVIDPACPGAMVLRNHSRKLPTTLKGGTNMSATTMQKESVHRAKLSAIRNALKEVTKTSVASSKQVKLEKRKSDISTTCKRLMASGKLTPAEYKKMDITRLAALPDDVSGDLMKILDAREPVIMAGQFGSKNGIEVSDIAKGLEDNQKKRLRAEVMGDFKRLGQKVSLAEGSDDAEEKKKKKIEDAGVEASSLKSDDSDDKKLSDGLEDSETQGSTLDALQKQIDELNTQVARIAGMVDDLMGSEEDESDEVTEPAKDTVAEASEAKE